MFKVTYKENEFILGKLREVTKEVRALTIVKISGTNIYELTLPSGKKMKVFSPIITVE